jgi:hypothetical protein
MGDEMKYKVWGYPAKTDPLWNQKGKFIGSADKIEEARKLQESAKVAGWRTVKIYQGDFIVD